MKVSLMFSTVFSKLTSLSVNSIMVDVAADFVTKKIPVITSKVASGKTMLVPAACSMALNTVGDNSPIYVLQPTRTLANNASDNLIEILDGDPNGYIGYLSSARADEQSRCGPNARLIFTTVGYAVSSGIILTEKNFILDEAHELSIELSIAKAMLHRRLATGEDIRLAVMSATLNLNNEMKYMNKVLPATHYTTDGSAYPLEMLHRPAFTLEEAILEQIEDFDRTGILVFVSGVPEIEKAINDITTKLSATYSGQFEIYPVHGKSTQEERRQAGAAPTKPIKIVVGTNVIESGISWSWVNGGVSSGMGKIMTVSGNVHRLVEQDLPQWRVTQQGGRCCRFMSGVFTLCSPVAYDKRETMHVPDIRRLPLTELVMTCAKNNIPLSELVFSDDENPDPAAIRQAIEELENLDLITVLPNKELQLTADGVTGQNLPLSYRSIAMYCQAKMLSDRYNDDIVALVLPLIAYLETGDVRHKFNQPYERTYCRVSDPINAVCNIAYVIKQFSNCRNWREEIDVCAENNINHKRLNEFRKVLTELKRQLDCNCNSYAYLITPDNMEDFNNEIVPVLMTVLQHGLRNETYPVYRRMISIDKIVDGDLYRFATPSNSSSVMLYGMNDTARVAGDLRLVTSKTTGRKSMFIDNMSIF